MCEQEIRVDPNLDAEHELVALVLGLDRLWSELSLRGEEGDMRRNDELRPCVEHDSRFGPSPGAAGLSGRQIDIHIDIRNVEKREDLAAGRQHLADIGDAILDAAESRRDQGVVGDIDLVQFDVVSRGVERALGFADAGVGRVQQSDGAVQGLPALIQKFLCGVAARDEGGRAFDFLLSESDLSLLLHDVGVRFIKRLARLQNLGLGSPQRCFEIPRIHARDDLARRNHVALVDVPLEHAPRKLGVDVDFLRLDAAVARHDAFGKARLMLAPPVEAAGADASAEQRQSEKRPPAPLSARRRRLLRQRRKPLRHRHESRRPGL